MSKSTVLTPADAFRMGGKALRSYGPRSQNYAVAQAELARRAAKHAPVAPAPTQAIPPARIPAPAALPLPVARPILARAEAILDAVGDFWAAVEAGHIVELDGMPVYVGPEGAQALELLRELAAA